MNTFRHVPHAAKSLSYGEAIAWAEFLNSACVFLGNDDPAFDDCGHFVEWIVYKTHRPGGTSPNACKEITILAGHEYIEDLFASSFDNLAERRWSQNFIATFAAGRVEVDKNLCRHVRQS